MANKEIKQTIRLAGEKEYSAAIKDAQRNLRTLKSELKAETAELGANATAQQKAEARAKSLKAQIAEQEKVVQTLKKALAEAKKDYGDNEDVVQKWEQKLNEARATLANLQNGLSDAENAMRGTGGATAEGVVATKSFADALGEVASVGESVSGAIEGIFTGLISTVRDVVVDLWDLIGETAAKANNWTDIAGYWDTEPVNVQKWSRALDANGKSLEDFETIVSKIVLGGKGKDIAEMLGISDVNYKDQWDYAVAVMDRLYDLRESGNLPDNVWETIFGEKKATKAMDLLNAWQGVKNDLSTFDAENGGYGWTSEEQKDMDQLYVDMERLEAKWTALKDSVALGFGRIAGNLIINVEGGLDALNDYMNADNDGERQAALEKLRVNVETFFRKVAEAIRDGIKILRDVGENLSSSDDPIVSAVGKMLKAFSDTMEWIINHQEEFETALKDIFGVWLMARLTMIAGKLAAIIAQIETIKAFKGISTLTNAVEGGAAAAGGAASAANVVAGGYLDSVGAGMAGSFVVTKELLEHRLKREDVDKIAQDVEDWKREHPVLPSPMELTNMGYSTGYVTPNTIPLDPSVVYNTPAKEIEEAITRPMNAMQDFVDRLMTGTDQQGKNQGGLTSEDVGAFKGLPGLMRQALLSHIDGLKVYMDGEVVGRLVMPYVGGGFYRMVTE